MSMFVVPQSPCTYVTSTLFCYAIVLTLRHCRTVCVVAAKKTDTAQYSSGVQPINLFCIMTAAHIFNELHFSRRVLTTEVTLLAPQHGRY